MSKTITEKRQNVLRIDDTYLCDNRKSQSYSYLVYKDYIYMYIYIYIRR